MPALTSRFTGIETLLSVTVASTILYGVYLVLFVIAVYLHSLALRDHHTSTTRVLRSPVFIGTVALFVTITTVRLPLFFLSFLLSLRLCSTG